MRRLGWLATSLLGLAAAVALIVVLVSGGGGGPRHRRLQPPPVPPPRPRGEQYGSNVNRLFDDRTYTLAQIDAQLTALRNTGATLARSDTQWEAVEPAPGHFDWRFDDLVAGSLARHGLEWLALLDYSAGWARAQPALLHSPPRSPTEFAAFAAAFAARYGRGGTFWRAHPDIPDVPVQIYEVWNEPDNGEFWQPAPNAAAYADLYMATRAAIARVDPYAQVIVGGLAKSTSFLSQMLAARPQLRDGLAGVGVHPYGRTPAAVLGRLRHDRQMLRTLGLGTVPLYITEFGWTTRPGGSPAYAPERRRPDYLTATVSALGHTNCGVAAVVLYTWVTPERNPADREDWYGVSPPQAGPSRDGDAFAAGVDRARRARPVQSVCGPT
jgi:hypothetical protein